MSTGTVRLKHISWLTSDIKAVISFYHILGGEVLRQEQTAEGYGRVVLRCGGVRLQFFQIDGKRAAHSPHWAEHLALEVKNVAGLVEQLVGAGYCLTREVQRSPSGRAMAFVADPDGRQIELLEQRPKPARTTA